MNNYFFEYGAVQEKTDTGPRRIIECSTSANEPIKISDELGLKIVNALNEYDKKRFIAETSPAEMMERLVAGDIAVDDIDDGKFNELLAGLARIFNARVFNCVDATGKNDGEWRVLSAIFDRSARQDAAKNAGKSAKTF